MVDANVSMLREVETLKERIRELEANLEEAELALAVVPVLTAKLIECEQKRDEYRARLVAITEVIMKVEPDAVQNS